MKKLLGGEVIHKKYGNGVIINAKKSGSNKYLLVEFESGKKDWFNMDKIQVKVKTSAVKSEEKKPSVEIKAECNNNIALKVSTMAIENLTITAEMLEGSQETFAIEQTDKGSIAILTGKAPKGKETQRMVFAVGIIAEISENSITLDNKYSITLTADEAEKILFWNFHKNTKAKTTAGLIRWGTTQTRNLTDTETVQILKVISEIKANVTLLDYYCAIKNIDKSAISEPDGGLQAQEE